MPAIRNLLLAGACAGLSTAAQAKSGRSLLQTTSPPLTGDAQIVNTAQQAVQSDAGGLVGATTGITGGLTGISGRHLLQSPTPPVTTQLTGAVTDAGNIVVGGASQGLQTLQLVPQPKTRHLLQATSAPETGIAQLVNTVQQQAVQNNVGGLVGATTGITGGLTGISGRHLLQSPTPPVTSQVTSAVTNAGNIGVGGASQGLQTLELVPESKTRHLLQATSAPETGIAQLVNTVQQQAVQKNVGGLMGAVTDTTGGLTGISGRHLLQSPPAPVTSQVTSAAINAGNTLVGGVGQVADTLELVSPPPAMR